MSTYTRMAALLLAIATWGIAAILMDNPLASVGPSPQWAERAQAAIDQGRRIGAQTQRERDYIEAVAACPPLGVFRWPPSCNSVKVRRCSHGLHHRLAARGSRDPAGPLLALLRSLRP